jgi:hypothetical protein
LSNTVEGLEYSGKYPKAAAASQQVEGGRRPGSKAMRPAVAAAERMTSDPGISK